MVTHMGLVLADLTWLENLGMWPWLGLIVVVGTVTSAIAGTMKHTAREKTRREIAAYIAEGSMTPEQGERILGKEPRSCGDRWADSKERDG